MFSWIILERFPPTKQKNRLQHASSNGYWGFAPLTTGTMRLSFAQMLLTQPENEGLSTLKRDHVITSWWFQPFLKNICQNGNLPQIGVKIKNIWKHLPDKETIYSNHQLFRGHVGFHGGRTSTFGFVLNMLHMLTTDLGVFQYVTNLTWNKMSFMITLLKYLEICVF